MASTSSISNTSKSQETQTSVAHSKRDLSITTYLLHIKKIVDTLYCWYIS